MTTSGTYMIACSWIKLQNNLKPNVKCQTTSAKRQVPNVWFSAFVLSCLKFLWLGVKLQKRSEFSPGCLLKKCTVEIFCKQIKNNVLYHASKYFRKTISTFLKFLKECAASSKSLRFPRIRVESKKEDRT